MIKKKYSKKILNYKDRNITYFLENDEMLNEQVKINKFYASQPKRKNCKLCNEQLTMRSDFYQFGVKYIFCDKCSHLNGENEDTIEFINFLYKSEEGASYNKLLLDKGFKDRAKEVYAPKRDFLLSSLPEKNITVLDVGCGIGHFVFTMIDSGKKAFGIDIGKAGIDYGNHQISETLNQKPLVGCSETEFIEKIKNTEANVISALGVIEHLREPNKFFEAFKDSRSKYLFYSVPMFSMSTIFENIFSGIFPRQLSGGHTHLFTEESIKMMHNICDVKPIAEWRFGTDMIDLYRSMKISLDKNNCSERVTRYLDNSFYKNIDDLQNTLDESHFCSEIHIVAEKQKF